MDSPTSALWALSFSLNADKASVFFGSWWGQAASAETADALGPSAAPDSRPGPEKGKRRGRNWNESNNVISFFKNCARQCRGVMGRMYVNTHTQKNYSAHMCQCGCILVLGWSLISHMGAGCTFASGVTGVSFALFARRKAGRLWY